MKSPINNLQRPAVKVFVATTVMLTFISFWRAAAIVLSDLASSAYYVGGDAEKVIGKSAPWFVLAVMLFSYAVRSVYIESSTMFVRGGVYRVVKEAMGGTLAKLSVSALLFDYVLTGPISAVSAGQYFAGFVDGRCRSSGPSVAFDRSASQLLRRGLRGAGDRLFLVEEHPGHARVQRQGDAHHEDHHRDGGDADRLVPAHDCSSTGAQLPPLPSIHSMKLDKESLGWLHGTFLTQLPFVIMLVGFGHSVLAMSGEESLAQVNREIEHPKLKNLEKAGAGDLPLQPAVHLAGFLLRGDDHSGQGSPGVLRQPDQRAGHVHGRTLLRCGSSSRALWCWWAC